MRVYYVQGSSVLSKTFLPSEIPEQVLWIDVRDAQARALEAIEVLLNIKIPVVGSIVGASDFLIEGGATCVQATLIDMQRGLKRNDCTFVITKDVLVTIRSGEFSVFEQVGKELTSNDAGAKCMTSHSLFMKILRYATCVVAGAIKETEQDMDDMMYDIFSEKKTKSRVEYSKILKEIGSYGLVAARVGESVHTLVRALNYLSSSGMYGEEENRATETLAKDLLSLEQHSHYLGDLNGFLLDTALGMINLEQNTIMRVVSTVSVVFLPPTLVSSVYGMNFAFIPLLQLEAGYPIAITLMAISALLPYLFFRWRKWL